MTELEKVLEADPDEVNLFANGQKIGEVGCIHLMRHIRTTPTLQLLELKGSSIGHKGAEYLAKALTNHISIKHLGVARNGIDSAGVVALIRALRNSPIQTLDFEWNSLQDSVAFALGDLLKLCTTLLAVNLERNDIRGEGVGAIASALHFNTTLRNLNLAFNKAGSFGALRLGEMLKVNTGLLTLNLSMNGIYPDGSRGLAEALLQNKTLRSLNLQNNQAIDAFAELGNSLFFSDVFTELNFYANRFTPSLASGLEDVFRNSKHLIALSLGKCAIGEPALNPVLDGLSQAQALRTLDLSSCGITAASSSLIASLFTSLIHLRAIYLDENRIEKGGEIFCEAIAMASNLTVLSMNLCHLSKESIRVLAGAIKARRGLPLQQLGLAFNKMGNEACVELSEALCFRLGAGACALTSLDLSGNELAGTRASVALATVLSKHTNLASITIRDNPLRDELSETFVTREVALAHTGGKTSAVVELKSKSILPKPKQELPMRSNFNTTTDAFIMSAPVMKRAANSPPPTVPQKEDEAVSSPMKPRLAIIADDDKYVPGMYPMVPFTQQRHQLHRVEENVSMLPITETQLRVKFQELDKNANGWLSAEEFLPVLLEYELVDIEGRKTLLKRMIAKHAPDGKIFFDAFSILMLHLVGT